MLTVKQVSKRLSVSPKKVYQLVATKRLTHHRFGNRIRFTEEDLADYLDKTRTPINTSTDTVRRQNNRRPKLRMLQL